MELNDHMCVYLGIAGVLHQPRRNVVLERHSAVMTVGGGALGILSIKINKKINFSFRVLL